MENWKTDANLLKPHHFEFPSSLWRSMGANVSGVPELPGGTGVKSLPRADDSLCCRNDEFLPVTRRFQPGPAALEELVDVLYRLLLDVPADQPATASVRSEATCFSTAPE